MTNTGKQLILFQKMKTLRQSKSTPGQVKSRNSNGLKCILRYLYNRPTTKALRPLLEEDREFKEFRKILKSKGVKCPTLQGTRKIPRLMALSRREELQQFLRTIAGFTVGQVRFPPPLLICDDAYDLQNILEELQVFLQHQDKIYYST
jgi:hypothetical protein